MNYFEFEIVMVNAKGEMTTYRESKKARYEIENLGHGVTLEVVSIPSGTFIMGSSENEKNHSSSESPQHSVTVGAFWMSKYPITQAQWQAVMGNNPSEFKGENHPVEKTSWQDAVAFCERLSEKTGEEYRLPSEAEWEYACRAGTITPFCFGETITTDLANYDGNYTYALEQKGVFREKTTDVGTFPPNAFGLYDMHGNVWEWCADIWCDSYKNVFTDGSAWGVAKDGKWGLIDLLKQKDEESIRLLRGGSWGYGPSVCRSADRIKSVMNDHCFRIGIRVVRVS